MTRKGRLAAIALLLMAMLMLAACSGGRGNPGSTAPNDVAVAAMKAMTQAADVGKHTKPANWCIKHRKHLYPYGFQS